jgi:hypothetical protein
MNRTPAIALLLLLGPACTGATSANPAPQASVLFIGNSLTYTNGLPEMVERIARAAGDSVRVGMVAGPNLAVVDHTVAGSDAGREIARGPWSFVVLQQGPTPAGICRDTLVIAAMRLAPAIRDAGARPALFLPWARRAFPQSLEPASESATAAARAVGGAVLPIGIAWRKALEADPALPLYGSDGYHPAPVGTLLAALTVYDRLFGRDVRTIPTTLLADLPDVPLSPPRLEALAAAAHAASREYPPDPAVASPADTIRISTGGGPC